MTDIIEKLMRLLREIYDNRDFVCGAVSNAGCEASWKEMYEYILYAKKNDIILTSDEILLLSLELGRKMRHENILPEHYSFPAVFSYDEKSGIAVVFYDIELATQGDDEEEAMYMAKDALGGRLDVMEEYGDEIPSPTPLEEIPLKEKEKAVMIDVYMPDFRSTSADKLVATV